MASIFTDDESGIRIIHNRSLVGEIHIDQRRLTTDADGRPVMSDNRVTVSMPVLLTFLGEIVRAECIAALEQRAGFDLVLAALRGQP